MERLGLVSVLKVERLVSVLRVQRLGLVLVLRVWEIGTSRSRLGLEGSMSRSRLGLESLRVLHFYTGVIRPVLEYAAPVWNHLLTKTQIDQIEAIQRRALRIIYSYTNDMPYINALYCAAILSLADRREQLSRKFFFSIGPRTIILPLYPLT